MIKTSELRKGNIVAYDFGDAMLASHKRKVNLPLDYKELRQMVIQSIWEDYVNIEPEIFAGGISYGGFHDENLIPVPITVERLLSLGFTQMITPEREHYYLLPIDGVPAIEGSDFIYNIKNNYVYEDHGITVDPIGVKIFYLHELQNSFFWLTGTELKAKAINPVSHWLEYLSEKGIEIETITNP